MSRLVLPLFCVLWSCAPFPHGPKVTDICVTAEIGPQLEDRRVVIEAWLISGSGWYATLQSEKCPDLMMKAVFRRDAKLEFASGEAKPTQAIKQSVRRGLPPLWSFIGTFRGIIKRRDQDAGEQALDEPPIMPGMPYAIEIGEVTAIRVAEAPPSLRSAPPAPPTP
jgi:hypothetical protein